MDMLRSCYTVDMQFDAAGEIVRKVRWYFVPDDTPSFPYPQKFGSQVWQWRGFDPGGIGELATSERVWSNGSISFPIKKPRLCDHVPVEWFDEGCPSDTPDLKLNPLGQPVCCAPASGLYVGGKYRLLTYPPQVGGLKLYGTLRLSRIYYLEGGILPGGEYETKQPNKYKGGVLLGGKVKIKYKMSGGVLLSATSRKTDLLRRKGGLYQGATKDLMLIKVLKGGNEVGGLSKKKKALHMKGGVKPGGHYTKFITCQPWYRSHYTTRTLKRVSTNQFWSLTTQPSQDFSRFVDPVDFGNEMFCSYVPGNFCFGTEGSYLELLGRLGFFIYLQLVSFSLGSYQGIWKVPANSRLYPNEEFIFFDQGP